MDPELRAIRAAIVEEHFESEVAQEFDRTLATFHSHPRYEIMATGAVLMTKLVHELHRTGGRYGLQTMCEGGGQANATIIERV